MNGKEFILTNRELKDLNPLIVGEEECVSCHSFGPAVRNYTLIHYVLSGKGVFYARGGVHPVQQGQAFIILPGEVTTYTADAADPWHYRWIGFDGELSQRFLNLEPVIDLPELYFDRIMRLSMQVSVAEYLLAGELLSLYAYLFANAKGGNSYVLRVENYIHSNYMRPIRVEQIASELNLNRRYLSRIFKEETGASIQEYLVRIRLIEAEKLLRRGGSVKEVAHLTGYDDVSNFSKMFKKYTGKSPATLRG